MPRYVLIQKRFLKFQKCCNIAYLMIEDMQPAGNNNNDNNIRNRT